GRMVWLARQPQATLDAAGLSTEGPDQRPAAAAVVGDRRSLHGIDRDSGAGAQRRGGLRARLPLPMHLRRRPEALGFQGPVQLGRGPQALARARTAQCGDGRPLPGELLQVPGSRVTPPTFSPLSHAGAGPLQERIWWALAQINDPEM